MAISHLVPESQDTPDDLVTLKEACEIVGQSPHPCRMTTLKRWIEQSDVKTVRKGRTDYVSMSDVFVAQYDAIQRRQNQYR